MTGSAGFFVAIRSGPLVLSSLGKAQSVLEKLANPHSDLSHHSIPVLEEASAERIPVLVTTAHRGVFFGFASPDETENKAKITLTDCRNCLYWQKEVGGFLGLAATGPSTDCRVGASAKKVVLHDITSVSHCTAEATAAWTR